MMENLDFSTLFGNTQNSPGSQQKQKERISQENDIPARPEENPLKTNLNGKSKGTAIPELAREAEKQKILNERSLEICQEYQKNIQLSDQLRSEILLGARAGESVESLLLKAAKAISIMTGDSVFLKSVESYLNAKEQKA